MTCELCSNVLPNCDQCDGKDKCRSCKYGYNLVFGDCWKDWFKN